MVNSFIVLTQMMKGRKDLWKDSIFTITVACCSSSITLLFDFCKYICWQIILKKEIYDQILIWFTVTCCIYGSDISLLIYLVSSVWPVISDFMNFLVNYPTKYKAKHKPISKRLNIWVKLAKGIYISRIIK
jgi:hypothetical protein